MFFARPQSHLIVVKVTDDSLLTLLALLASVGVAVFTGWLAWQTRKLAKQTEADVSAQWRPVLIYKDESRFDTYKGDPLGVLRVRVFNAGSGAALNATVCVDLGSEETGSIGMGTIPKDQEHWAEIPSVAYIDRHEWTVVARYEDLGGVAYVTRLTLEDGARNVRRAPEEAVTAPLGLTRTSIRRESDVESTARTTDRAVLANVTASALRALARAANALAGKLDG